jgi:hypothetical protein
MDEEPLVRVVRGTPDAAEVAALVVALTRRSSSPISDADVSELTPWVRSGRPAMSPRAWRGSGLPT